LEFFGWTGPVSDRHEITAVALLHRIRAAIRLETHRAILAERTFDERFRDRLGHLDMKRLPPRGVLRLVAALAGDRSDVGAGRVAILGSRYSRAGGFASLKGSRDIRAGAAEDQRTRRPDGDDKRESPRCHLDPA